jgi:hypothetical protein
VSAIGRPLASWSDTGDLPPLPRGVRVPDAPPRSQVAASEPSVEPDPQARTAPLGSDTSRPGAGHEEPDGPARIAGLHLLWDRTVHGTPARLGWIVLGPGGAVVVEIHDGPGRVASDGLRLRVGRRDRSDLIDVCLWKAEIVRAVLAQAGLGLVPVRGAVCWTARRRLPAKPIELRGIPVLPVEETVELVRTGRAVGPTVAGHAARVLSSAFPATS